MNFIFQIIILISKLPLKILYLFSDFIYFLIIYVVGYRKKVVLDNLRNSFPEKSEAELKKLHRKFFVNFSDYLVETAKSFTMSEHELRVRVQHINQDVFREAEKEGKNIILLAGHVFNWEWFNALASVIPQDNCHPVYRNMQNEFWEEKLKLVRNRYGNQAVSANDVIKHILKTPNDGNTVYMFVADQTPHVDEVRYGVRFLNQATPAFIGYDKLATKLDLAFIYCDMKRVKRGYYQVNYYRIYPDNEKFAPLEIVSKFHKHLENTIRKFPDNYLWSHRKWKYDHAIKTLIED